MLRLCSLLDTHFFFFARQIKGKMPHKLIRKGTFSELHFDPDYDFLFKERDKVRAVAFACQQRHACACSCAAPVSHSSCFAIPCAIGPRCR